MTTTRTTRQQESIAPCGEGLRAALDALVDAVPGAHRRPSAVARRLGVNRVIVSRLLNALKRPDPLELLQHAPGPESLRSIADGAAALDGVPDAVVEDARESIEGFASLIRDRFGTRGALNAAISDESETLRRRYEESARYEVYDGMRHVIGAEGETWLTAMIFAPSPADDDALAVTTLHGVLGLRRLRPDAPVRFTFGPPYEAPGAEPDPLATPIALDDLFANDPAPIETELHNGQLVHMLAPGRVSKDAISDMLVVSHDPRGCPRYASPERPLGGVAMFQDVPVRALHCDAIVHQSAFPAGDPRLIVYNPGSRGPANPNDPTRDFDRIRANEPIETFAFDPDRLEAPGIPNYAKMLARTFDEIGESPNEYRVYRVRVAYPVQGFQYVLAFEAPARP